MASPTLLRLLAAGALLASAALAQSLQATPETARAPVLVELFTSEGCSDCPPADRLLEELDRKQIVPGAQAIVLSEHVTYWNHTGWRDPFSLDEMDYRQKEYGKRFNLDSTYTPQAVIDGTAQLVGNKAADVIKAVKHAASTPKKSLTVADARWENGAASFTVRGAADPGSKLVAVLAADGTGPKITSGENAGRTIHHVAVVRTIKEFGANVADGRVLRLHSGNLAHDLAHDQASAPVRLVVFLVDRKSGHVTAVSEQNLSR